MENYASSAWSEIIAKAAVSPLGIAALVVLVVGVVVVTLIRPTDKPRFRLSVVIILMVFCGALMGASIYGARPTSLPAAAAAGAQTEGPSQQPPVSATVAAPGATATSSPPNGIAVAHTDCGTAWTGWVNVGGGHSAN
jgi:disulfide bond formation protein DsbB